MDFSRFIPAAAFPVFSSALKKGCWLSETTLDLPLHYKLLLETEETLRQYPDLSDALIRDVSKRQTVSTPNMTQIQNAMANPLPSTRNPLCILI